MSRQMGKSDAVARRIMREMAEFREFHLREMLKQWVSEAPPCLMERQPVEMLAVELLGLTAEGHSKAYAGYRVKKVWYIDTALRYSTGGEFTRAVAVANG